MGAFMNEIPVYLNLSHLRIISNTAYISNYVFSRIKKLITIHELCVYGTSALKACSFFIIILCCQGQYRPKYLAEKRHDGMRIIL